MLEVDEGYLGAVADAVHPEVVALLNLSRDQLDRVSEVRMVAARWRARAGARRRQTVVVANADDPLVVWGARARPRWCGWRPGSCGATTPWVARRARAGSSSPSGDWSCTCGFRRPAPDAELARRRARAPPTAAHLPLRLALPGRCNLANAAMAAVAAGVLGVDEADGPGGHGNRSPTSREGSPSWRAAATSVRLLLAKNPAGWTELLDLLEGGTDPVVIGINARIADGHDPSWLWDVPFERLAGDWWWRRGSGVATWPCGCATPGWPTSRCPTISTRCGAAGSSHGRVRRQLHRLPGAAPAPRPAARARRHGTPALDRRVAAAAAPGRCPAPVTVRPEPSRRGSRAPGAGAASRARSSGPSALRVVVVHPDLLGTYGDGGNGRVLAGRAVWRDIPVELVHAPSDAPLPAGADVYCLGGGEDGPQVQSAERLRDGVLAGAVDAGAVVLRRVRRLPGDRAVVPRCRRATASRGGPARRGHGEGLRRGVPWGSSPPSPSPAPPVRTTAARPGAARDADRFREPLGASTALGPGARPLAGSCRAWATAPATAPKGHGRAGCSAPTLHGPALARNPSLADLLLGVGHGIGAAPPSTTSRSGPCAPSASTRCGPRPARRRVGDGAAVTRAPHARPREGCAARERAVAASRARPGALSRSVVDQRPAGLVVLVGARAGSGPSAQARRHGEASGPRGDGCLAGAGAPACRPPVGARLVGQGAEHGVDAGLEPAGVLALGRRRWACRR